MINLAEFHFIRPIWLLALIPAFILLLLLLRHKLGKGNWTQVCDAELLPYLLKDKPTAQHHSSLTAAALACLLTILALAGPTWERLPSPVFRNDSALVIALDLSLSMNASDIKPSRLIRARYKIEDILNQRKDGQTALLVYAGDAFTVTPLTNDTKTIASQINALTTDIMPSHGHNTLAAVQLATNLLKQSGLQQGNILLITDGVKNRLTNKITVELGNYTLSILGVGTPNGAPVKMPGGFLKDAQGNIIVPKLDVATLASLARKSQGRYHTISRDDSDIKSLLAGLNSSVIGQQTPDNPLMIEQWDEKGPWLFLLIIPLAALSFRKGLLTLAFLLILPFPRNSAAMDWQDWWQTKDQQAQQAFNQKHYQQAAKQFESAQWKAAAQYKAGQYQQAAETLKNSHDADSYYNRGNALARNGQLQEAIDSYQQALDLRPDFEDAKANKELLEKQLKKQHKQQQQKPSQSNQHKSQKSQSHQNQSPGQNAGQKQIQKSPQQKSGNTQKPKSGAGHKLSEPTQAKKSKIQSAEETRKNRNKPQSKKKESQQPQNIRTPAELKKDENRQAREQWLKRIPDDPSGLLKRKFRYQYSQRRK